MSLKIPGYKLIRVLGKGGMATVYLAEQEIFERQVALKVMSRALAENPLFGQRFMREAKIVSQLVHPNIVTVHDVGQFQGHYYLSMEYIDGEDLKHAKSQLSISQIVRCIRDIAKALEYAGSKGYVHRDIKPENIMFHKSDGRAVLMDFGIARAAETDTAMTQTGTAIGTPHYMSPEQAKGQPVDQRSDIYSLGVVFFLLLSGYVPYDAESAVAIGIKHITEPVPQLPQGLEGLQQVIDTMMAKKLEYRYASASELIEDLDALNLDLIEQAAELAKYAIQREDSLIAAAPTIMTPAARAVDYGGEFGDSFGNEYTVVYEDDDDTRRGGYWWKWLLLALLAGGGGLFYQQRPELVQPWLDQARVKSLFYFDQYKAFVQRVTAPEADDSDADKKKQKNNSGAVAQAHSQPATPARQPSPAPTPSAALQARRDAEAEQARREQAQAAQQLELRMLREKVASLEASYARDSLYLSDLVVSYHALAKVDGEQDAVAKKLAGLRQAEFDKLRELAQKPGAERAAQQHLQQLQHLFPAAPEIETIQALLTQRQKIATWLSQAEQLRQQNRLTQPEDNCAWQRYRQVLRLEANNAEALAGLDAIATTLEKQAAEKFAGGDLAGALAAVEKSLAVQARRPTARALKQRIHNEQQRQQDVQYYLARAEQKLTEGQLFQPHGAGAFHDFQQVLSLDPDNSRARQGVEQVIDRLSARVWQLVGEEQFDQAKALLSGPLVDLPDNARVKSLSLAVDEVISDRSALGY